MSHADCQRDPPLSLYQSKGSWHVKSTLDVAILQVVSNILFPDVLAKPFRFRRSAAHMPEDASSRICRVIYSIQPKHTDIFTESLTFC